MKRRWLVRASVIPAFLALACHDSPSGTRSSGDGVSGPPPFITLTIDGPVPYDNSPIWGGLNLFEGGDGSTSIISMDYVNNRLRFAHCDTGCDVLAGWSSVTVDSGGIDGFNSGAAMGSGGFYAVYSQSGTGIRFVHCASGCASAGNWSAATLFAGLLTGPHASPLAVDAGGGLNLVFQAVAPGPKPEFIYAHCTSVCDNGASWTQVQLDSGGLAFSIVAETSGRLDLVYQTYGGLTYLSCDSSCTTGTSWTRTVIDPRGAHSSALALSGSALYVAYTDSINAVHYLTCSANCTTPTSWQGGPIGKISPNDVAIGVSGGAIAIATNPGQLAVSTCMSGCRSPLAWQSLTVDSARAAGGGYLSLGIGADGHAHVASTVNWLQYTHITQ